MDKDKNTVLIIDDEVLNIKTLMNILREEYEIFAEVDSREAVVTANEIMPDIILLDIVMPEMDGHEVISALKSSDKTRSIPVIFITGLDNDDAEEKGLILGAADYIAKPFCSAIVKLRVKNQIKIINQIRTIENIGSTDQLTCIANRRGFDNYISREWGRAMRESLPISVLMIDLDGFKIYNDTYGHPQGDVALQIIAGTIQAMLKRTNDMVARWGGEEFIVSLPNTNEEGAVEIAEKIRLKIEQTPIPFLNGESTMLTASIGVNTIIPKHDCSIESFIEEADKALYRAKNAGKNRVCVRN
jgi:diguanylate cyclase (GGDEF)-like protein